MQQAALRALGGGRELGGIREGRAVASRPGSPAGCHGADYVPG